MREALILVGAGAAFALAFPPSPTGWLVWFTLVPFIGCIRCSHPGRSFLKGWLFGTAGWAVGMRWFYGTIAVFFHLPWPVALLLFAVFCLYHGLMLALVSGASAWLGRRIPLAIAFIPVMVCADGYFPMMFPIHLGNTQYHHLPAIQSVDLFGMGGLTWLIAAVNAALYTAWKSPEPRTRRLALLAALLLPGANELYGRVRIRQVDATVRGLAEQGKALTAALIQGSMPDEQRFVEAHLQENLALYNGLTSRALADGAVDLVLWPQNTYERLVDFDEADTALSSPRVSSRTLESTLSSDIPHQVPLLLGATGRRGRDNHYLSILTDARRKVLGVVAKRDLTPFSEFIPLGAYFPFLYSIIPQGATWLTPGPHRLMITPAGSRLGAYICYEALLPASARELSLDGAEFLVNQSSDWFGDGVLEPEQILQTGAVRAIENRRFLLRPVTSGISAAFDPVGREIGRIPFRARSFLKAKVVPMTETTVQARIGPLFYRLAVLALALMTVLCLIPERLRR